MKVPAFLGSSFAYLGGFETVAKLDAGKYAGMSGDEKLAYALGCIVIAGLLYLVLALLFKMLSNPLTTTTKAPRAAEAHCSRIPSRVPRHESDPFCAPITADIEVSS